MKPHPGITQLNQIAAAGTDGRLQVEKVVSNKEGHHAIQWCMTYAYNSWFYFNNPSNGYPCSLDDCIARELDEIEERIKMDIFGTELFPYIAGEMLAGKGQVTLTIKDVRLDELKSSRGTDRKPVVYFQERDKGLILNKTNAKKIAKLYGRETDDWRGKKIGIYAEQGEWFGQTGYAIRVADTVPTNGNGNGNNRPPETVEEIPFEFGAEPPWDSELATSQNGDDGTSESKMVYENGTVVKADDEAEAQAFVFYYELEGNAPPSRAALTRWSATSDEG